LASKRSRSQLDRTTNPNGICGVNDLRSGLRRPFGAFKYMDARGSDRPRLVHRRGDNTGASLLVGSRGSRAEGLYDFPRTLGDSWRSAAPDYPLRTCGQIVGGECRRRSLLPSRCGLMAARGHARPRVTRANSYDASCAPPAPSSSSCHPTRQTSIRSNRCSPNLKLSRERPPSEPSPRLGSASANCSTRSHHENAPTISQTPDTLQPKTIML
jgi:hypothetical protein